MVGSALHVQQHANRIQPTNGACETLYFLLWLLPAAAVPFSCITEVSFDSRFPDTLSTRATPTKASVTCWWHFREHVQQRHKLKHGVHPTLQTVPSLELQIWEVMCVVRFPASRKVRGLTKVACTGCGFPSILHGSFRSRSPGDPRHTGS